MELKDYIYLLLIFLIFILAIIFRKNIKSFLSKTVKFFIKVKNAIKTLVKEDEDIQNFRKKHENIFIFLGKRMKRGEVYGLKTTIIFIIFFILFLLFIKITRSYLNSSIIVDLDIRIANLLYYFRDAEIVTFFKWITSFGHFLVSGSIIGSTALILFVANRKKFIIPFVLTIGAGQSVNVLLKNLFERPRPMDLSVYQETSFSFPSGHSTIAVLLFGFIIYLIYKNIKNRKIRNTYIICCFILIILIGLSRLYLGVHYFSDVLGGYILGAMFLFLGIFLSELLISKSNLKEESKYKKDIRNTIIVFILLIQIIFYVGFNFFYKYKSNILIERENAVLLEDDFDKLLNNFTQQNIKKYSETLVGKNQQPLSFIVLVENDEKFLNLFNKAGWKLARHPGLRSLAKTIKAAVLNKNDETAPLTPGFWNANIHDFGFQKPTEDLTARIRHHARFWKTNIIVNNKKVYVGTASFDVGIKWFITHRIAPDIDTERDYLFNDLKNTNLIIKYKKENFVKPVLGKNFGGDAFFTNGEIYLIEL